MNAKVKVNKDAELTPEVLKELAKSIVNQMGPQYSAEEKKEHYKVLMKVFERGMEPYEAMKITKEDISQIYLFAYRLFCAGRYEEAAEVFKMLYMLMPLESGFATSLGVCYHKLNDYEKAVRFYLLGAFTDPTDPVPLLYAYDCFLRTNDMVSAGIMLSNAVNRCGDNPKYAKVKDRASVLLESIEKQLTEIAGKKNV